MVERRNCDADEDLRRALDAAMAANAAKTRYLVAVSHEIRSPLNAIYGYAQLLEREGAIPPAEAGSVIRLAAEHLTNLVEGLLDISRIESGVLKVRQDVVRLPALLDHVVDMFRMQAAAKGLSLDYIVNGRLPPFVRADEKRLRQILINLLSNAIKYTREGGVTLSIACRSQTALVEVADTGIGIAVEDIDRIFRDGSDRRKGARVPSVQTSLTGVGRRRGGSPRGGCVGRQRRVDFACRFGHSASCLGTHEITCSCAGQPAAAPCRYPNRYAATRSARVRGSPRPPEDPATTHRHCCGGASDAHRRYP